MIAAVYGRNKRTDKLELHNVHSHVLRLLILKITGKIKASKEKS